MTFTVPLHESLAAPFVHVHVNENGPGCVAIGCASSVPDWHEHPAATPHVFASAYTIPLGQTALAPASTVTQTRVCVVYLSTKFAAAVPESLTSKLMHVVPVAVG